MKIAVIGAGISGMGCALALSETHDVTLFEAADRLGGHANTVEARFGDRTVPVDTGFIVYNTQNYPNLTSMFAHLDVPTKWSDMSFGLSMDDGAFEYACDSLDKLFAQRMRVMDIRHIRMLRQILRFMKTAPRQLAAGELDGLSLGEWIAREGYGDWFRDRFLIPMGGAIWSTRLTEMFDFPARNFINFFVNHDLMTGLDEARQWRTVDGGSREYVRRVAARLGDRVVLARRAVSVEGGHVRFADGGAASFDHVVLACHAPEALALIRPDREQQEILGAFRTSPNRAVLHSDPALMPRRRKVWSSWSVLTGGAVADADRPAQLTYWMNRLQSIPEEFPLFVTLNPVTEPDPALVHSTHDYAHPLYTHASFAAQERIDAIQGRGGVWFAGAWLGYGFHEDGLRNGLRVAEALGARPAWVRDTGTPVMPAVAHAAE
ncbi:FAD-dependent oxidoreductase [Rhodobacteraceae bacterium NNCM2]|nr:FAD-dependent oxidoreductase [Coraliihabitans acroporae]